MEIEAENDLEPEHDLAPDFEPDLDFAPDFEPDLDLEPEIEIAIDPPRLQIPRAFITMKQHSDQVQRPCFHRK